MCNEDGDILKIRRNIWHFLSQNQEIQRLQQNIRNKNCLELAAIMTQEQINVESGVNDDNFLFIILLWPQFWLQKF